MKLDRKTERLIMELASLARDLCPQAEVIISPTFLDDFIAEMDVVVPDDTPDEVYDALSEKNYQLDMEHDCNIFLNIIERSRYEAARQAR